MLLRACRVEPGTGGSNCAAFRRGASRLQDAAGTKNRKSDLYVPRYTKMNRLGVLRYHDHDDVVRSYTSRSECSSYTEIYRDIPSYRMLYRAIPSYTHPGMCPVIPSIAWYILWPKVYTSRAILGIVTQYIRFDQSYPELYTSIVHTPLNSV